MRWAETITMLLAIALWFVCLSANIANKHRETLNRLTVIEQKIDFLLEGRR